MLLQIRPPTAAHRPLPGDRRGLLQARGAHGSSLLGRIRAGSIRGRLAARLGLGLPLRPGRHLVAVMAGRQVIGGILLDEGRDDGAAHLRGERAARVERASRRHADEARRRSRDGFQTVGPALIESRQAGQQSEGIRMTRVVEDVLGARVFGDPAGVHHHDPVGMARHQTEVVGDEHDGGAALLLKILQQLHDLSLHGHVERGRRLVRQQQDRVQRESHGDHGALSHTARELVGILFRAAARVGDADLAEQFDRPRLGSRARERLVNPDHLGDLASHFEDGVQRRQRVLEDHRYFPAPQPAQAGVGCGEQVLAPEHDPSGRKLRRRRRDQAHDRHGRHRLARAGLADDAQRFSGSHLPAHAVDRLHHTVVGVEMHPEVFDGKQRFGVGLSRRAPRGLGDVGRIGCTVSAGAFPDWLRAHHTYRSFGSRASRRPSPTKTKASTVKTTAAPGSSESHGWLWKVPWPAATMLPHSATSGLTPTPR